MIDVGILVVFVVGWVCCFSLCVWVVGRFGWSFKLVYFVLF